MELDAFYIPIDEFDLSLIEELLRSKGVFTPSFVPDRAEEVYQAVTYRLQESRYNTGTIILADRNLVTRWVAIARGAEASLDGRIAAAVMAFAHCGNILIEPNIALYEAASTLGSHAMNEELATFQVAENLDTGQWSSIALGTTASAPTFVVPAESHRYGPNIDFEMPPRRWRRNYVIALKLAELELRRGPSDARMAEMLKWMYQDFLIGGPALVLAAHYLAPNSPRQGLFTGLRSPDRSRALLSVRNVAWDLTLLSEWSRRAQEQRSSGTLTLLGSLDRGVHKIARTIGSAADSAADAHEGGLFQDLWGKHRGRRLDELYGELKASADNPARQLHRPADPSFIDSLIASGEALVRNWR